jgi:probable HAF family extracellular repeat protein
VLSLAATVGWSQSLTWLGTLGGAQSVAYGVSADGSVVVGGALNAAGQWRAFRWTATLGMQDLGTLGGAYGAAHGVSVDGTVVVGESTNAAGQLRAFRWVLSDPNTGAGVMSALGTLGGAYSAAYGVSAGGTVVVGESTNAAGQFRAFRWVLSDPNTGAGVMFALDTLGGDRSAARGVSANGAVVVGGAQNAAGQWRAFRWTATLGMQNLDTLPGYDNSLAYGVSANGAVVIGESINAALQWRAFRWVLSDPNTGAGVMFALDTLGGDRSAARGVSADGAVVVGESTNATGQRRAFRWTVDGGMEDLNITYASLLTPGSELRSAYAISSDGRYIVGLGYNAATGRSREAFLLDTGPRCTRHDGDVDSNGCIDDADLLAVLFAFGNSGSNLGRVDVNCDGVVDDADLLQVLFNFGSGC